MAIQVLNLLRCLPSKSYRNSKSFVRSLERFGVHLTSTTVTGFSSTFQRKSSELLRRLEIPLSNDSIQKSINSRVQLIHKFLQLLRRLTVSLIDSERSLMRETLKSASLNLNISLKLIEKRLISLVQWTSNCRHNLLSNLEFSMMKRLSYMLRSESQSTQQVIIRKLKMIMICVQP